MAQAEAGLHEVPSSKQRLRYADSAVYAQDAALLIEQRGVHHVSVVTQGYRDTVAGRAPSISAVMTIGEAVKARRALSRVIRSIRARQAEHAS